MLGKVKWFSDSKGYGFIKSTECDDDIFIHYSEIINKSKRRHRTLIYGQEVEFELKKKRNGYVAINVIIL